MTTDDALFARTFFPDNRKIATLHGWRETGDIAAEPMLFSAGLSFAGRAGGPLTLAALDLIQEHGFDTIEAGIKAGRHIVIDTRVQLLMPGMFPAIPGWHCDAYPRQQFGEQPNIRTDDPACAHFAVTLSDNSRGVSRTRFLRVSAHVQVDESRVWGSVHDAVEAQLRASYQGATSATFAADDGDVIQFGQTQLHRATRTERQGWRFWLRLSLYHRPPLNRVRRQTQVYVVHEGAGW